MKKAILVGNPNVGKSLLFSRITRMGADTANYAGTTVSLKVGRFFYGEEEYELVDGPGVYSLEAYSEADSVALRLLEEISPEQGDLVIDVVDATNLERNLGLTLQLAEKGLPLIVCLNFWDDTKHKGIAIDLSLLSEQLGLPVVATSALDGSGVAELVASLGQARPSSVFRLGENAGDGAASLWDGAASLGDGAALLGDGAASLGDGAAAGALSEAARWAAVGHIVGEAQKLEHRHHSFLERLSDFTLHPVGGPVSAFFVLVATLLFVRFLGEGLINSVLEPLYSKLYAPFVIGLADRLPWPFAVSLLVGSGTDPLASFGVLTTGLYIALVLVFPYFFAFYLVFGFLEDFGYLPRLAVVLDKAFHRLGLHGYSSIPIMLGLGCKVPAFMSTRMLSSERERTLTIALIFMSAPCLPQTSMIVALGMNYGILTVVAVFASLVVIALATNAIINGIMKGEDTELFTELPAYRLPRLGLLARKLGARIGEYFGEVLPMIAVGVLALNLLDALGVIAFVTEAVKVPARILFGLPEGIAPIMILGFLRKDVSIALLAPLGLSSSQFVVASVFLALYTPCVAAFFSLVRESGLRGALRIVALVLVAATIGASALHFGFAALGL
jgi:ferrous iron transport protein B